MVTSHLSLSLSLSLSRVGMRNSCQILIFIDLKKALEGELNSVLQFKVPLIVHVHANLVTWPSTALGDRSPGNEATC